MKSLRLFFVFVLLLLFAGCARDPYLSKDRALIRPAQGISIPHPVEIEKAGVEAFTSFTTRLPFGLFPELDDQIGIGVWVTEGYDESGETKAVGYCYYDGWPNLLGDFLSQCYVAKRRAELEGLKFLVHSRDTTSAFNFDGQKAVEILSEEEIKTGKKPVVYNSEEFDKSLDHRKAVINKFGQTLSDAANVNEIIVGSPEWEQYKEDVNKSFPEQYKMPNGEIRIGTTSLENFQKTAVSEPGLTSGARFIDALGIPIPILAAFTPVSYLPLFAASSALTYIGANAEKRKGLFNSAWVMRGDMGRVIRRPILQLQTIIQYHLEREAELERQLRIMRPLEVRTDLQLN